MKILITGNMGYVGSRLVCHLRAASPEATLIGLDTGYFANCLTDAAFLPECQVDVQHFMDVRRMPEGLLEGIDAIVHLAAISNDPMGKSFEEVTYDVNYRATVRLARMAREAGVGTFVYASSCSMYGAAEDSPRTEDSPLAPLTAYAKSKVMSEKDLAKLADDDFQVTCLRFSTACGMSERLRLDLVLNDFVAAAVISGKITILSDGSPWRPLINVRDMARAIEWALFHRPAEKRGYLAVNVGRDDWNRQVKDLAGAVAELIPGVEVSINQDAQPDKRSYRVDFSLYRELAPNHQPAFDLQDTIRDLKKGLENMKFADPDFRSSIYMRLMVLNHLREKSLLNESLEWAGRS